MKEREEEAGEDAGEERKNIYLHIYMKTSNDKPLNLGLGVEASEIWGTRSVPEIGAGSLEWDRDYHEG